MTKRVLRVQNLKTTFLSVVVATGIASCQQSPRAPSTMETPAGTALPCLSRDSLATLQQRLVYSDVEKDSATGDLSGLELTLLTARTPWEGSVREGRGGMSKPWPLIGLLYDSSQHSLFFKLSKGSDTGFFQGRLSCDSVWGLWVPYPRDSVPGKAFRRLR